jgi:hypothetical protein
MEPSEETLLRPDAQPTKVHPKPSPGGNKREETHGQTRNMHTKDRFQTNRLYTGENEIGTNIKGRKGAQNICQQLERSACHIIYCKRKEGSWMKMDRWMDEWMDG